LKFLVYVRIVKQKVKKALDKTVLGYIIEIESQYEFGPTAFGAIK